MTRDEVLKLISQTLTEDLVEPSYDFFGLPLPHPFTDIDANTATYEYLELMRREVGIPSSEMVVEAIKRSGYGKVQAESLAVVAEKAISKIVQSIAVANGYTSEQIFDILGMDSRLAQAVIETHNCAVRASGGDEEKFFAQCSCGWQSGTQDTEEDAQGRCRAHTDSKSASVKTAVPKVTAANITKALKGAGLSISTSGPSRVKGVSNTTNGWSVSPNEQVVTGDQK